MLGELAVKRVAVFVQLLGHGLLVMLAAPMPVVDLQNPVASECFVTVPLQLESFDRSLLAVIL